MLTQPQKFMETIYGDRLSGPVTGADIVLHVVVNDTYGHPVLLLRVERGLA